MREPALLGIGGDAVEAHVVLCWRDVAVLARRRQQGSHQRGHRGLAHRRQIVERGQTRPLFDAAQRLELGRRLLRRGVCRNTARLPMQPAPGRLPSLRRIVGRQQVVWRTPSVLCHCRRRLARVALPQGDELQHVARAFGSIGSAGMGDVEMRDHERAGRHLAHEHLAGFDAVQVGVEVAAGEKARRPHRQGRVLREVEDVGGARTVPARSAGPGVAVLMPAGTGHRTLAHARAVLEGVEGRGVLERFAVVGRTVRRPGELRAEQAAHGAAQHGRFHELAELRNARQHVVARPRRLVLHAVVQLVRHRCVEVARQAGIEHQEAVGEEAPHLVVGQRNGLRCHHVLELGRRAWAYQL